MSATVYRVRFVLDVSGCLGQPGSPSVQKFCEDLIGSTNGERILGFPSGVLICEHATFDERSNELYVDAKRYDPFEDCGATLPKRWGVHPAFPVSVHT